MDSGNSGSMQSSSGGGDEQEFHSSSRGGSESISSFLNSNFTSHHHQQQQFLSHQTFFQNPFQQQNPTTTHYNDHPLIWSGLRSDQHHHQPNYTNFPSLSTPSSSSIPLRSSTTTTTTTTTTPQPSIGPNTTPDQVHTSRSDQLSHVIKNPKKRTRASRRAPTTVLTTDTTNFRQMVQEFTGIPAVPFSGSPYSRRLDLFSAASALRPGPNIDTLGPMYPLRPAAHKMNTNIPSQFSLNSSMLDSGPNNNSSLDHLLNLHHQQQQQQQQQQNVATSLLQGFGNQMGGYAETNRGEPVRNNNEVEESLMRFDVNVNSTNNTSGSGDTITAVHVGQQQQQQEQQQQQNMMRGSGSSGYNRNSSNVVVNVRNSVSDKGGSLDNVVVSSVDQGNVASWICPSD